MVHELLNNQNAFYRSGVTKSISFRVDQLKKLRHAIRLNEAAIVHALKMDLNKPEFEAYSTEVGYLLDSIKMAIKNTKKWAADVTVKTPIYHAFAKSIIKSEPYGTVLIVAPFNYPFQLMFEPLIGAIAAGNTAILKPSELTPNVEAIIVKIVEDIFNSDYIAVVTGGREELTELIHLPFDYIFFTGSVQVGKVVMKAAAENLIPVTLELGGKSPTVVHEDANIAISAKRIAWGKFMNAGQICIAPDYVYVHESIEQAFIEEVVKCVLEFYGPLPMNSPDYCRIVNERHLKRLVSLLDHDKIVLGGQYDFENRYLSPTIMKGVSWDDAVMQDEIFGPILPILTYKSLDELTQLISKKPKPLAFYIFSESKQVQEKMMSEISFGGGCINDTILHVSSPELPFGGVGTSGMGSYHGKESFKTFSHYKSILNKPTQIDLKFLYPPYKNNVKLIKKIMK